jgi:hypothetical protein
MQPHAERLVALFARPNKANKSHHRGPTIDISHLTKSELVLHNNNQAFYRIQRRVNAENEERRIKAELEQTKLQLVPMPSRNTKDEALLAARERRRLAYKTRAQPTPAGQTSSDLANTNAFLPCFIRERQATDSDDTGFAAFVGQVRCMRGATHGTITHFFRNESKPRAKDPDEYARARSYFQARDPVRLERMVLGVTARRRKTQNYRARDTHGTVSGRPRKEENPGPNAWHVSGVARWVRLVYALVVYIVATTVASENDTFWPLWLWLVPLAATLAGAGSTNRAFCAVCSGAGAICYGLLMWSVSCRVIFSLAAAAIIFMPGRRPWAEITDGIILAADIDHCFRAHGGRNNVAGLERLRSMFCGRRWAVEKEPVAVPIPQGPDVAPPVHVQFYWSDGTTLIELAPVAPCNTERRRYDARRSIDLAAVIERTPVQLRFQVCVTNVHPVQPMYLRETCEGHHIRGTLWRQLLTWLCMDYVRITNSQNSVDLVTLFDALRIAQQGGVAEQMRHLVARLESSTHYNIELGSLDVSALLVLAQRFMCEQENHLASLSTLVDSTHSLDISWLLPQIFTNSTHPAETLWLDCDGSPLTMTQLATRDSAPVVAQSQFSASRVPG